MKFLVHSNAAKVWEPEWSRGWIYRSCVNSQKYRLCLTEGRFECYVKARGGGRWDVAASLPAGQWERVVVQRKASWRAMGPSVRYWMIRNPQVSLEYKDGDGFIWWNSHACEFQDQNGCSVLALSGRMVRPVKPDVLCWEDLELPRRPAKKKKSEAGWRVMT